MNILDTLVYIYKADVSDLLAKEKDAEATVDKTTTALDNQDKTAVDLEKTLVELAQEVEKTTGALGVQDKKATDLGQTFDTLSGKSTKTATTLGTQRKDADDLGTSLAGLALKISGVVAAFMSWGAVKAAALAAAEDTQALAQEARSMYISADELRTWTSAVVGAGGSASGLAATIKMLSERTRDPLGALERVADRFKGLTDRQADRLGKSLGIDQSLVDVLRMGTTALQERIKHQMRLGEVTQEQIGIANKYKLVLNDTNTLYDDVRRRIMAAVLPSMTAWLELLQEVVIWTRDNSTFVLTFFGSIASIIMARMLPAIVALGAQWLRTSALFLASPLGMAVVALVAVGAAIALVVDDIMAFEEGGKSLIGDIAQRWPVIGDIVHNIVDALKMLWEIGRAVFQYLKDSIYQPATALANLKARLAEVFDAMADRFPVMGKLVKAFATNVGDMIGGAVDIFTSLFNIIEKVWKLLADSPIGAAVKWVADRVEDAVTSSEVAKPVAPAGRYQLPTDAKIAEQRKEVKRAAASSPTGADVPRETTLLPKSAATPVAPRADSAWQKQQDMSKPLKVEPVKPATSINAPLLREAPPAKPEPTVREIAQQSVVAGKVAVEVAAKNPMNSNTSNTISNNAVNNRNSQRTTTITTGPITVQTQATDAQGVATALGKSMQDQLKQATDNFDDGMAI